MLDKSALYWSPYLQRAAPCNSFFSGGEHCLNASQRDILFLEADNADEQIRLGNPIRADNEL